MSYIIRSAIAPDDAVASIPNAVPGIGNHNALLASLPAKRNVSLSLANIEPETVSVSPLAVVPILTYQPLPSIVTKGGLLVVPSDVTHIVLMTCRALSILVEILNAKSDPPASHTAASNQRYSLKNFFMRE